MQKTFFAAALFGCFAWQASAQMMEQPPSYQSPAYQPPAYQQPSYQPAPSYPQPAYAAPVAVAAPPFCQPYKDSFHIGGEERVTRGTACLRQDGAWELHPQQLGMRYESVGNGLIFIPVHPFAIGLGYYHDHHHHDYYH
jgi:hypothetical protein